MIEESMAFLVAPGQGGRLRRRALLRRLRRPPGVRARLPAGGRGRRRDVDHAVRHQRRHAARRASPRSCATVRAAPAGRAPGHPHPQRRRVRRGQQPGRRRGGRPPGPGHDQRLRRALRQRQPGLDHPLARAQDGLRRARARAARRAHRAQQLRRRDGQPAARLLGARTSGRNAFAHKGGMHVAGHERRRRARYEHIDPARVGNERRVLVSELSGRGTIVAKARELGVDVEDDPERVAGHPRAAQGAGAPGLPLRGGRRLLRAAARARDRRLRAALHARELPRHHREARRRPRRDRGHGQDLPRRRAPGGHGRGQRPGQRPRRRPAPGPRAPGCPSWRDIELVNFKVRILDETKGTGAATRVLLDSSDGTRAPGARSG